MNLDRVKELTQAVEDAIKWRADAQKNYDSVRALCGQSGYTITIGGIHVQVASTDMKTYMAKLNRGCDMIHLGVLKVLSARVDFFTREIAAREATLKSYINGEAK